MRKTAIKLSLRHTQYFAKLNVNHKPKLKVYLTPSNQRCRENKLKSQKVFTTGDRVFVTASWILERLGLTTMVTLEGVSRIVETIHSHKTGERNCPQSEANSIDLQEKLMQVACIIDKVTKQLEDDWQNSSVEEREACKKVYNELKTQVQPLLAQNTGACRDYTDGAKTLSNSLEHLIDTLADAIEFECISSEVSNVLSVPFTEDEVKKADAAIARLTAEVNSQEYSPEEIWARFDAVRDKLTSTTKPQN